MFTTRCLRKFLAPTLASLRSDEYYWSKPSPSVPKMSAIAARVLRAEKQPLRLPMPTSVRQRRTAEQWRDRIWQVRRKFLLLLHPQYRELMRKMTFSMNRAEMPHMVVNLKLGVFFIWCFTSSVQKMEEFVLEVEREGGGKGHVLVLTTSCRSE
jgi:hypothetical protein